VNTHVAIRGDEKAPWEGYQGGNGEASEQLGGQKALDIFIEY